MREKIIYIDKSEVESLIEKYPNGNIAEEVAEWLKRYNKFPFDEAERGVTLKTSGVMVWLKNRNPKIDSKKFKNVGKFDFDKYKENLKESSSTEEKREFIGKKPWDWNYFKKLKKPKNDLVAGIIPQKSLIMVYGPPKSFKSIFLMDLCACLQTGRDFLGKFKTKKTNCLYIDVENNKYLIKDRLERIRRHHRIRRIKGFYYLTRESRIDILESLFIEHLKDIINVYDIGFLVLDTLPKMSDYDTNSEREVNKIFNEFFRVIQEDEDLKDISIAFILHTNKGQQSFLGSQAYHGIVDCSYKLIKDPKDKSKVGITSDNRGENITFGLQINFTDKEIKSNLYEYAGPPIKSRETKTDKTSNLIMNLFEKTNRMKKVEITQELSKIEKITDYSIKNALKTLVDTNKLSNKEKGIYVKNEN
ncbi:AAA family ATPase [Candidatus Woesearchaeota archaeon]|nr:AAA family ATPase [Candidatus Woesearchaeota archaeon]